MRHPLNDQVVDPPLRGAEEPGHVPEVAGGDEDQGRAVMAFSLKTSSSRNLSQIQRFLER
jgi:hypothetical protein